MIASLIRRLNTWRKRTIWQAGPVAYQPAVLYFDSTHAAYAATQGSAVTFSGDVLVIESEGVVGILDQGWPVAITEESGDLHTWTTPAYKVRGGAYLTSLYVALHLAGDMDLTVCPRHLPIPEDGS